MAAHMGEQKSDHKESSHFGKKKKGLRQKPKLKQWQLEVAEHKRLKLRYDNIDPSLVSTFEDIPLCGKTRTALNQACYKSPTEIQRMSIAPALQGHDVLGAAKTGSGKTLAFLIPILECLFRNQWSSDDGLGALVISPTRELAYQTFEVLCKVGKNHDFSAGLIIGGKDMAEEMEKISRTNIVVCTPGRLLHHMDQTVTFECANLKILVLDEADRILDLGFQKTVNAIIEHLPPDRQTLLFSATQTKSVQDLARLSLKDPKYVAVHQDHEYSTPSQLEQSYVVCELDQKADLLFSFIKNHKSQKILVFMASCKQVKYMFDVFCKLGPGTTIMALYGSLNQLRRVSVYNSFCRSRSAVLFATDIAARGLDFPKVNWVVQVDCPEDVSTYIHRVGRTARYAEGGEALLLLLPSEEDEMVRLLGERKIPIEKIKINPNKKMTIQSKLESFCAEYLELKQAAQRCFIAYIKSVYLMKNKKVFDVRKLNTDNFALSLGLAIPPRVRFLLREEKRKQQMKQQNTKFKNISNISDAKDLNLDKVKGNTLKVKGQDADYQKGSLSEESKKNMSDSEDVDSSDNDSDSDVDGFKESMLNALKGNEPQKISGDVKFDDSVKSNKRKGGTDRKESLGLNKTQDFQKRAAKISQLDSSGQSSASGISSDGDQSSDDEDQSSDDDHSSGDGHSSDDAYSSDDDQLTVKTTTRVSVAGFHGNSDGEEDDDDNLFTTVNADVFGLKDKSKAIYDSDNELMQEPKSDKGEKQVKEESKQPSQKKPRNRIQLAKKLTKKRMVVNTKTGFDDEGEAYQQWPPRQRTVTKIDEDGEEKEYIGGVDIAKAQEFMSLEDKHDKATDKRRIKAKHRAQRLKAKQARRRYGRDRQEDGDGDENNFGVTLDMDDDYEPVDPDSLPDPLRGDEDGDMEDDVQMPKVWVSDGKEESGDGSGEVMPTEQKESRSKKKLKRTRKEKETPLSKNKKARQDDAETIDSGMTLHEDEELALHILGNM